MDKFQNLGVHKDNFLMQVYGNGWVQYSWYVWLNWKSWSASLENSLEAGLH